MQILDFAFQAGWVTVRRISKMRYVVRKSVSGMETKFVWFCWEFSLVSWVLILLCVDAGLFSSFGL